MIDTLLWLFNSIPHLAFNFKWTSSNFSIDWTSEYAQSLAILAAAAGAIALLLLSTIIITWICQCCSKDEITGKSRRKVRRLSTILFILSVFCFFFLGFSLFGNEHINRGIVASTNSLADVNRQMKFAVSQVGNFNETCLNATEHIAELTDLVHSESKRPGINHTMVQKVDVLLTDITDSMDGVTEELVNMTSVLKEVSFLDKVHMYAERIEIERWITFVLLLSIMLCVLFVGVISFCRQSKKGAVVFSGLGMVIFIVTWITLCLVFPLTVALSDFCMSGGAFIHKHMSQEFIDLLEFYRTCDERPSHDNVPAILLATNISDALNKIQTSKVELDALLDQTFNHSKEIADSSAAISSDATLYLKQFGAMESSVACYAYHRDVLTMHNGVCDQSVIGAAILFFCLLLLALFLFVLLLIVSRSWHLFSRLPSDYVEVDEDDPFFPRTNDSNIPVDIYGTHVFNPRTRERTEPSTNTTTASANNMFAEDQTLQLLGIHRENGEAARDQNYGNYRNHYDL